MNSTIPGTPNLPGPYLFRYYQLKPAGEREYEVKMVELLIELNETNFFLRKDCTEAEWLADLKDRIRHHLPEGFSYALHDTRTLKFLEWAIASVKSLGFGGESILDSAKPQEDI